MLSGKKVQEKEKDSQRKMLGCRRDANRIRCDVANHELLKSVNRSTEASDFSLWNGSGV